MKTTICSKQIKSEAKAIGKTINAVLDKHKAAIIKSGYPYSTDLTAEESRELHDASKAIVSLENAALIIKRIR